MREYALKRFNIKQKLQSLSLVGAVFNLYLLLLVSYLMLYLHNWNYGNATLYKQQKFLTLSLITGAALIACAAIQLIIRKFTLPKPGNLSSFVSVSSAFAVGFVLVNFISALFSPYLGLVNSKGQSLVFFGGDAYNAYSRCEGIIFTLIYVLIFLLAAVYGKLNDLLACVASVTAIIMNFIGLVQLLGWNIFNLNSASYYAVGGGLKYVSTVGQFNIYSISGTLLLAFCGGCFIGVRQLKFFSRGLCFLAFSMGVAYHLCLDVSAGKLALVAAVILLWPYMLSKTETRLQTVTLTAGLLLGVMYKLCVIPYYPEKVGFDFDLRLSNGKEILIMLFFVIAARVLLQFYNDRIKGKWLVPVVYGSVLLFGLMIAYYFRYNFIPADDSPDLFIELSDLLKGNLSLRSGTNRMANWYYSMRIFKEYPVFGSGPGTFYRAFTEYSLSDYQQAAHTLKWVDLAHNDYVQYLCTTGIVGLLTYLGLIGTVIFRAVRRMGKNPRILALLFPVIMFMIQNFFIFALVAAAPVFFMMLGLLEHEILATPLKKKKHSGERFAEEYEPDTAESVEGSEPAV